MGRTLIFGNMRTMLKMRPFIRGSRSIRVNSMSSLDFEPVVETVDPLVSSARTALEKSCYLKINWKVSELEPVSAAVARMAAYGIGALAVTEGVGESGPVIGVISERDYITKVASLGGNPTQIKIGEVCTHGRSNLVTVTLDNPIDACMRKVLARDIRHLLIREKESGSIVGMLSIKDLVKCVVDKHEAVVGKLTNIVLSEHLKYQI